VTALARGGGEVRDPSAPDLTAIGAAFGRAAHVLLDEPAARGFPWVSFYSPADIGDLAAAAGFDDIRLVSASALNERYFAGRSAGLRAASGEHLVAAARRK
jgi:hypothetical protein